MQQKPTPIVKYVDFFRDPQVLTMVCLWLFIGGLCVYLADALAGGL